MRYSRRLSLSSLFASIVVAISVAVVTVTPSKSQMPGLPDPVELTPRTVAAFLDSYGEIEAHVDRFRQRFGPSGGDPEDPTSWVMGYARNAEARQEIEAIVTRHGLGSLEEWSRVAYSTVVAYSFSERDEEGLTLEDEMEQALEQMRSDPSMPPEQKEQVLAMMRQQMDAFSAMRPSEGNLAAIEPYRDRIRAIIEDGDGDLAP